MIRDVKIFFCFYNRERVSLFFKEFIGSYYRIEIVKIFFFREWRERENEIY